jgi:hypothetical protein
MAVVAGVCCAAGILGITFGPPLMGPLPEAVPILAGMSLPIFFLISVLSMAMAIVNRRPWKLPAGILLLLTVPVGIAYGAVDRLWAVRFEQSKDLRREFLVVAHRHMEEADQEGPGLVKVELPPSLRRLSNGYAYSYRDESGAKYAAYAVVTFGIDNSTGFVWSETGAPPPPMAFPQLVRYRPMGDGWFMFWST